MSGSFIANTVGILMLTFSGGQGAIVVNYRIEEKKLVSMKEGKDVTGWRWKQ